MTSFVHQHPKTRISNLLIYVFFIVAPITTRFLMRRVLCMAMYLIFKMVPEAWRVFNKYMLNEYMRLKNIIPQSTCSLAPAEQLNLIFPHSSA